MYRNLHFQLSENDRLSTICMYLLALFPDWDFTQLPVLHVTESYVKGKHTIVSESLSLPVLLGCMSHALKYNSCLTHSHAHTLMHTHLLTHMHTYTTHTHTHSCTRTSTYTHKHTHTHAHVRSTHTHKHTHTHAHVRSTHIHTQTFTRTHTGYECNGEPGYEGNGEPG